MHLRRSRLLLHGPFWLRVSHDKVLIQEHATLKQRGISNQTQPWTVGAASFHKRRFRSNYVVSSVLVIAVCFVGVDVTTPSDRRCCHVDVQDLPEEAVDSRGRSCLSSQPFSSISKTSPKRLQIRVRGLTCVSSHIVSSISVRTLMAHNGLTRRREAYVSSLSPYVTPSS